jgi:hypothetical protein
MLGHLSGVSPMTTTTAPSVPASQPAYLRREQAAAFVQSTYGFPCSRQWLARLAVIGGGPAFRKASRFPLYDRVDLDSWAKSRIGPRVQKTAELSAA